MSFGAAILAVPARAALPAFFILLVVLGGASRGGFWANAALQIASAGVIAWCIVDRRLERFTPSAWVLIACAAALVIFTILQLVPVPPEIWSRFPGRQIVVDGFSAIGEPLPWLPLSMAPDETLFGVLKFLPGVAAFTLAAKLNPRDMSGQLGWTILLVTIVGIGLGLAQILGGRDSPLYFYEFTNWGATVGFMANVNHQATLSLMAIPFGAVVFARLIVDAQLGDRNIGLGVIVAALLAIAIAGVMITGSIAGYGLLLPAILLSFLIARGQADGAITVGALFAVSVIVGVLAIVVASSPRLIGLDTSDFVDGALARSDTYTRTLAAISDTMPIGSGLGSFEFLFPSYEDPELVNAIFMNHAHNDYLEVVLEFGIAGILLIAAFVVWFCWRAISIWCAEGDAGSRLRKAATVAVLIVMLHSIVDYPLRTAAISGFAGLCLGIMAAGSSFRGMRPNVEAGAEKARHIEI